MFFIRENEKDTSWPARIYYWAVPLSSRLCAMVLYAHYIEFFQQPCEVGVITSVLQTEFESKVCSWPPGKKKSWDLNLIYFDSCCWAAYCPTSQKNPGVPCATGRPVALFSYRQRAHLWMADIANTGWGAVCCGGPGLSQVHAGDISTCLCRLHLCFSIVFSQSMVMKASLL